MRALVRIDARAEQAAEAGRRRRFSFSGVEVFPGSLADALGGNRAMSPDDFIKHAIDLGSQNGVASLNAEQRMVFLISEAEVDCDKDGIDMFLDRYSPNWLLETAAAFESIGAADIAVGLRAITPKTQRDDPLLASVNGLITSRTGYDYDAIRRMIESRGMASSG